MIAVDTNILVYAHRGESAFHATAFDCLKSMAEGRQPWGIPVSCLHEFLSVVTNPKVFSPPSGFEQALAQIDAWLASPTALLLHSGPQHWRILSDLTRKAKLQGGGNSTTRASRPSVLKTVCQCCGARIATLGASKR